MELNGNEIVIDKDVPMPSRKNKKTIKIDNSVVELIKKMEVGDSFYMHNKFLNNSESNEVMRILRDHCWACNINYKFMSRNDFYGKLGYRIWRTN